MASNKEIYDKLNQLRIEISAYFIQYENQITPFALKKVEKALQLSSSHFHDTKMLMFDIMDETFQEST